MNLPADFLALSHCHGENRGSIPLGRASRAKTEAFTRQHDAMSGGYRPPECFRSALMSTALSGMERNAEARPTALHSSMNHLATSR